jgi:predicted HD phosphohydrolase
VGFDPDARQAGRDGNRAVTAIIDEIFELFARFGSDGYGEDLSLERHMLQSAALARAMGAADSVVVAALLHDIGYFLHSDAAATGDSGAEHEALGALWLSRAFPEAVTAPVAMHVDAKRYLCAVEPDYYDGLSQASRLSLVVQGGVMTADQAAAFAARPAFEAAIILRRCDDRGKDTQLGSRTLEDYRGLLAACLRQPG